MSSKPQPTKHCYYDPSMSKRTRKPRMEPESSRNHDDELHKDNNSIHSSSASSLNEEDEMLKYTNGIHHLSLSSLDRDDELQKDDDDSHRSSLKELMNQCNGHEKPINTESSQGDEDGGGIKAAMPVDKSSLALVARPREGMSGMKKGGMASRYVKMLSYLVKANRDSKKKTDVRLLKP